MQNLENYQQNISNQQSTNAHYSGVCDEPQSCNFSQPNPAQNFYQAQNTTQQQQHSPLGVSTFHQRNSALGAGFPQPVSQNTYGAQALPSAAAQNFTNYVHSLNLPFLLAANALRAPLFPFLPQQNYFQPSNLQPVVANQKPQAARFSETQTHTATATAANDGNKQDPRQQVEQEGQNPQPTRLLQNSADYWENLSSANAEYLHSTPARKSLKAYLQERCDYLDGDEIEEILALAKELETQAVEVFKAKGTHKTKLQEQNRQAIVKLNTDSANGRATKHPQGKTFTRADISKMDMREFMANQAEILKQYRNGAIL